jgi:hypothetical protein
LISVFPVVERLRLVVEMSWLVMERLRLVVES